MESALNLALDYNGVLQPALQSEGVTLPHRRALQPGQEEAREDTGRDPQADVLGFMTLPHHFRDNLVVPRG
jgi:hypothetical protein